MKRFIHALSRAWTWCVLLHKRILKKPAFLAILALTPLLALGLSLSAKSNNGMMTAAIWWDSSDAYAAAFGEECLAKNGVIRTVRCDTPEQARRMLENGDATVVWLLSEDFESHLQNFVKGKGDSVIMTIVLREQNAVSDLTRDRLFAMLFPRLSYTLFRERVMAMNPDPVPTEEELRANYLNTADSSDLIQFLDVRGETVQVERFLLSPVRGILSLLIVEGGIAAAIFCAEDEKTGVYGGLPRGRQIPAKLLSILLPMADLSLAAILSLWITGLLTNLFYELILHLLFLLAAGGFCLVLLALLRDPRRLALAAFLTAIATLALTPVFVDVGGLDYLSALLPTYHYLRGVNIPSTLPMMLLYALCADLIAGALFALPKKDG
ncbi:MAG: hypothetical protein J6Z79_01120 [Clostridia bacterium]|nr:hypothetical protein [Clostridia bacterium]